MSKARYFALLPLVLVQSGAYAVDQDIKAWATNANNGLVDTFKVADPVDTVPNYTTDPTGNEGYAADPNKMSSDAVTQSASDPGAELINGMPQKPNVSDDAWFQNASDITKDPTKVVDDLTGDYTDCEEVTRPGDSYTETKICTESLLPTTAECAEGRKLEVDANYLYECNKERQTTDGSCSVGRVIDVTQAHNYKCQEGRLSRTKRCNDSLQITVEKSQFKYPPQAMCSFSSSKYNTYGLDRKYLVIAKSTTFNYKGQSGSTWYKSYRKNGNTCKVYRDTSYYGSHTGWKYLFSGSEYHGCRPGDNLWDDGMCHSDTPIVYQSALPKCGSGTSLQNGGCVSQPAWILGYSKKSKGSQSRMSMFNSRGKDKMYWALNNGTGAYYYAEGSYRLGSIATGSLKGSAPGYPSTAKMKAGKNRTKPSYVTYGEVSILLSSQEVNAPTFTCNSGSLAPGSNMCQSNQGFLEYRIIDNWVYSCN